MKKSDTNKKVNKWIVFATMPTQMGVTIYLFYWIGDWLDAKYEIDAGWLTKGMTLIGVLLSLAQFIRQANHFNKNE